MNPERLRSQQRQAFVHATHSTRSIPCLRVESRMYRWGIDLCATLLQLPGEDEIFAAAVGFQTRKISADFSPVNGSGSLVLPLLSMECPTCQIKKCDATDRSQRCSFLSSRCSLVGVRSNAMAPQELKAPRVPGFALRGFRGNQLVML